jgi:hypothetical protein
MAVRFYDMLRLALRTSSPPPGEGELWYRSDTHQVHGSDGGTGNPLLIGPTGNLPVVRSGAWHSVPASGSVSAVTPTLNRLYAQPLWPGQACTLTAAAVEVTLLGVGNVRGGVYADNNGVPGSLIADFGTISTGLLGVKTWTPTPLVLRPVLTWIVVVQQGLINVGLRSRDTSEPMVSDSSAVLSGNLNSYYIDGVSGALPASFGVIGGTTQGPSFSIQLT